MLNLPKPQLGDAIAISINTPDFDKSMAYYSRLGFRELYRFDFPYPFMQITDDALLITLRKDNTPHIALTYYVKDIGRVAKEIESAGIEFIQKPRDIDMIKKYSFESPDALHISLVQFFDGFYHPEGPTMLAMAEQDYFNPEKYVNKVSGMFGEFSHPVSDLEASLVFWDKLGFKVMSKNTSPYPWSIISDGLAVVGLHQTNDFTQPAITYFASDMKDKISRLKASGLTDFSEAFNSNAHLVLTTPEKQRINLYSLGM